MPEFYFHGIYYYSTYTMPKRLFITISPPPRYHSYLKLGFANPNYCVYLDDFVVIMKYLHKYRIKKYIIFPEFDDHGRLHYHGRLTLTPSQEVSFFKDIKLKFEKYIGFVKAEYIKDEVANLIYCRKSYGKTQQMLDLENKDNYVDFAPEMMSYVYTRTTTKNVDRLRKPQPIKSTSIISDYIDL